MKLPIVTVFFCCIFFQKTFGANIPKNHNLFLETDTDYYTADFSYIDNTSADTDDDDGNYFGANIEPKIYSADTEDTKLLTNILKSWNNIEQIQKTESFPQFPFQFPIRKTDEEPEANAFDIGTDFEHPRNIFDVRTSDQDGIVQLPNRTNDEEPALNAHDLQTNFGYQENINDVKSIPTIKQEGIFQFPFQPFEVEYDEKPASNEWYLSQATVSTPLFEHQGVIPSPFHPFEVEYDGEPALNDFNLQTGVVSRAPSKQFPFQSFEVKCDDQNALDFSEQEVNYQFPFQSFEVNYDDHNALDSSGLQTNLKYTTPSSEQGIISQFPFHSFKVENNEQQALDFSDLETNIETTPSSEQELISQFPSQSFDEKVDEQNALDCSSLQTNVELTTPSSEQEIVSLFPFQSFKVENNEQHTLDFSDLKTNVESTTPSSEQEVIFQFPSQSFEEQVDEQHALDFSGLQTNVESTTDSFGQETMSQFFHVEDDEPHDFDFSGVESATPSTEQEVIFQFPSQSFEEEIDEQHGLDFSGLQTNIESTTASSEQGVIFQFPSQNFEEVDEQNALDFSGSQIDFESSTPSSEQEIISLFPFQSFNVEDNEQHALNFSSLETNIETTTPSSYQDVIPQFPVQSFKVEDDHEPALNASDMQTTTPVYQQELPINNSDSKTQYEHPTNASDSGRNSKYINGDFVKPEPAIIESTTHISESSSQTIKTSTEATTPVFDSDTKSPTNIFDPKTDADALLEALNSYKVDAESIINILTRRSNAQRLAIANEFSFTYGKNLVTEFKKSLSGKFKILIEALLTPLQQYYVNELHYAMKGPGTDENCLIEILSSLSNEEIRNIRDVYQNTYGRTLESDIQGDTSGDFEQLLISLSKTVRDESGSVNREKALEDAIKLLQAGVLKWGTDESTFISIITQRNYNQLELVFEEYEHVAGHTIEYAIKKEFSRHIKRGLLAIVDTVRSVPKFFAKRLHASMAGMGTNDRELIRIIVMRKEIDLELIEEYYAKEYGSSLKQDISDDTSGDYRTCLLALIGEDS
ncbi:hypothetical protein ILUMI_08310 [Ignelater luminosus]|uniref:Annexin n=1 Tax=Ignelater luminosus TaxID=2038154 RepID=A0A8K0D4M9_IGNLU|nr:hypothetical protein ILUMI_08310 [Ignelater luminosus]